MTETQFKELAQRLDTTNTILFAGFTALLMQINPALTEQEARDAILACSTPAGAEVLGILDETKNG